jgi:CheY-like chemotaxis protein
VSPVFVEGLGPAEHRPSSEPAIQDADRNRERPSDGPPSVGEDGARSEPLPVEHSISSSDPAPLSLSTKPLWPVAGPSSGVRRVSFLESGALFAAAEIAGLRGILDIHAGYLQMLEGAVAGREEDLELVRGAIATKDRLDEGFHRVLAFVRDGTADGMDVDLSEALASVIPVLARELGEGSRLRVAPPSGSCPVTVNLPLLEGALVQLMQNAREASQPGEHVRLSWGLAPHGSVDDPLWEGVRIRVADRGHGIPRGDFPWLFEPFFSTRTREHPMRGLGLPFVQAVVEGHGGWIEIRSRPGEGTEVDLFLPLSASAVDLPPIRDGNTRDAAEGARRVLVLEDEPLLAGLLDQILSREGYSVELYETPQEAERRRREGVDLLLVESTLPGGHSGMEVAKRWQQRDPNLSVMVLDRGGAMELPSDGDSDRFPRLTPPFQPREIARRVGQLLAVPPDVRADERSPAPGSRLTH